MSVMPSSHAPMVGPEWSVLIVIVAILFIIAVAAFYVFTS